MACRALHFGEEPLFNDNLTVMGLAPTLIAALPIDLWPQVVRRIDVRG